MNRKIILPMGVLAVISGCGDMEQPGDSDARRAQAADIAPQRFTVELGPDTTAENVIAQLVAAAHGPLASRCEQLHGGSVRIYNPLADAAFEDVSCASVLGGEAFAEATAALVTDEPDEGPVGEAQQAWSPAGLACSGLMLGSGLIANYALCPRARNPVDEKRCHWLTDGGFGTLGFLCFLF